MKLNPPNAHRSQFAKRGKREMCSFGSCQTRFEFLSQFRKVRNAFECFVTQVQTHLPKTKRVWPMKINVICTVDWFSCNSHQNSFMSSHKQWQIFIVNTLSHIQSISLTKDTLSRHNERYTLRNKTHTTCMHII